MSCELDAPRAPDEGPYRSGASPEHEKALSRESDGPRAPDEGPYRSKASSEDEESGFACADVVKEEPMSSDFEEDSEDESASPGMEGGIKGETDYSCSEYFSAAPADSDANLPGGLNCADFVKVEQPMWDATTEGSPAPENGPAPPEEQLDFHCSDFLKVEHSTGDQTIPIPVGTQGACLSMIQLNEGIPSEPLLGTVGPGRPRSGSHTRFICTICARNYARKRNLIAHQRLHNEDTTLISENGKTLLVDKNDLSKFKPTHKPFICPICGKGFARKRNLVAHQKRHKVPPSIPMLPNGEMDIKALREHLAAPQDEGPKTCEICGKQFPHKDSYRKHVRIHTEGQPFPCDKCNKRFTVKENLKRHSIVHLGVKPFACYVCGRCFSRTVYLKKHIKSHTGEREYQCDLCQKGFFDKGNLTNHIKSHQGLRPFVCEVCHKCFPHNDGLRKHFRSHTGDRPFLCSLCDSSFTLKGNLDRHIMTHTGERPFTCAICLKTFVTKANLRYHQRVHMDYKNIEQPFECDVCHKRFSFKGNHSRHMKTHLSQKPYICHVCSKGFSRLEHLKLHLRTHGKT